MDLKIKDVAELLSVSENTVRRWLQSGKIPAYRLNRQYRFSRLEIQNWVMSQKIASQEQQHVPEQAMPLDNHGQQAFSLLRAINRGGILHSIKGADKREIIRNTMCTVADRLDLDPDAISNMLLERERLAPTALNNGVAVPHTRDFLLHGEEDAIVVVFLKEPIDYGALDRQPVSILFFLFAHSDKEHLRLLARIAHLCNQPSAIAMLKGQPDAKSCLQWIRDWEAKLISEAGASL